MPLSGQALRRQRLASNPQLRDCHSVLRPAQLGERPHERVDAIRRIADFRAVEIRRERAHLIFEHVKAADVVNLALFVERRDGLRANHLAAARVHGLEAHTRVECANCCLDHGAAVIHFSQNPVGLVPPVR